VRKLRKNLLQFPLHATLALHCAERTAALHAVQMELKAIAVSPERGVLSFNKKFLLWPQKNTKGKED